MVGSYLTYLDEMIKLLAEKGFEATILVLLKVKRSFAPPEASSMPLAWMCQSLALMLNS